MRKLFSFLVIFLLISGAAFAQLAEGISIGASAQGIFSPFVYVGDRYSYGEVIPDTSYMTAGVGVVWGSPRPTLDLWVSGDYSYGGFKIGSTAEGKRRSKLNTDYSATLGDQEASFWIKPFGNNYLNIRLGNFEDNTLTGKIGSVNDSFEGLSLGGTVGGDYIFTGFGTNKWTGGTDFGKNHTSIGEIFHNVGFMISSEPIKGLFIGLIADGSVYDGWWGGPKDGATIEDVYRYMQVAAGYKIGDIAHIRAQYIGGFMGQYDSAKLQEMKETTGKGDRNFIRDDMTILLQRPARFELACALTFPGLLIDMGFKAHMPVSIKDIDEEAGYNNEFYSFNGFYASIGAKYALSIIPLTITARFDAMHIGAYGNKIVFSPKSVDFGTTYRTSEDDKNTDPIEFQFRICPVYDLGSLGLGFDAGIRFRTDAKDADGNNIEIEEGYSRFDMGFGVFSQINFPNGYLKLGLAYSPYQLLDNNNEGVSIFQIPVVLKVWFW